MKNRFLKTLSAFVASFILSATALHAANQTFMSAAGYFPSPDIVYYPISYHGIYSKDAFGKSLEIEDGSIWKVRSSDSYVLSNWNSGDKIVISPCLMPSYTGYSYYMTNKSKRNEPYVYVALQDGPIFGHPSTTEIVQINYASGDVILRDGKGVSYYFQVPMSDRPYLNDWLINQSVIVGANDNSYMKSFWDTADCILINVEKNRYIRATQY